MSTAAPVTAVTGRADPLLVTGVTVGADPPLHRSDLQ